MSHPLIIQGGMGVGVSDWKLARAVSITGQLGVISSTALDVVLARKLQLGDLSGHIRRALTHFPVQSWAEPILDQYYIPGGKNPKDRFKDIPFYSITPGIRLLQLTIVANFVEVFLAKEGHGGIIGINLLEKIQLPTLPSLLGAMLADVDYVLMGAGIPKSIPGILDRLSKGVPVELKIDVRGAKQNESFYSKLDWRNLGLPDKDLKRPKFLVIVSSAVLAIALARKSNGRVDGFVVEGPTAGGHNAPPRGASQLNEKGEPIYGPKDDPEIDKIRAIGLPFWLAGSFAEPSKLSEALALGASGIQVGTAFAFCEESGILSSWKDKVLEKSALGEAEVYTDPVASPTGFPFKVLQMEGSMSESRLYEERTRICDLGYLRQVYRKENGIGYRCPGEPLDSYAAKGGDFQDTVGRKCICNGLAATIGLAQVLPGYGEEKAILTAGDDVCHVSRFIKPGRSSYNASEVVDYLLQKIQPTSLSPSL